MPLAAGPFESMKRRLFEVIHQNNLVYNQCWEDPALDRAALDLTPHDRVLAITRAGCNVLDYALLGARVWAVDVNPRQNQLLQLKRAGIRALDFDAFFTLFGRGGAGHARDIYAALRPALDPSDRAFWDHEIRLFEPERLRGRSFYYRGTAGWVALALCRWIRHGARVWSSVERLLGARSVDDQLEIYHRHIRHRVLGDRLLDLVGSRWVMSMLGVPEPQRQMVLARPGGFPAFLRDCLDHVVSVGLLRDNYFWSVYLTGRYTRESCPEYLKEDNFLRLKDGLVDNVSVHTATVTDVLAGLGETVTAFVLLDHMDWMASQRGLLEEEWNAIFRAAAPGARAIFRSGSADERFLPGVVLDRLRFDREQARCLHQQDRVGTYASFHIARLGAVA